MRDSCCFDLQSFAAFDLFLTSAPSVIFNTSHFYISCCHSHTSVSPRFHLSFFCIVPLFHPIPPPHPHPPPLFSQPLPPPLPSLPCLSHTRWRARYHRAGVEAGTAAERAETRNTTRRKRHYHNIWITDRRKKDIWSLWISSLHLVFALHMCCVYVWMNCALLRSTLGHTTTILTLIETSKHTASPDAGV